ncbi:Uu.00g138730.m01.CDS01 [Anthostomella pinea]|uniref:Uu.00g138730.m01.CDS01 n=1 Tax=Anthostomella pinea TaxID=933095 RepID=A0AAI8VQY7_9PEZI|nr:Uu.00g138730.m01.CDS01 [Anthostomella pinea]
MELGLSVLPPAITHTHTIVFLHSRGSTAADASEQLFWPRDSLRRSLKTVFPSVRWVFPQAELRPCEADEGQDWSQWFDVWNPLDLAEREEVQALGLQESVESLRRLVVREARLLGEGDGGGGGGLERVVLAGVSQGGAAAVHALLNMVVPTPPPPPLDGGGGGGLVAWDRADYFDERHTPPTKLCALVAFSSAMPFPGGTLEETREVLALDGTPIDDVVWNTPAFLAHCADDPLVFIEYGKVLRNSLRDFGMNVTWREYEEGGHQINSPQGVDDFVDFLIAQGVPGKSPRRRRGSSGSRSVSPD